MKQLIEDSLSAIVFIFGAGTLIWLWTTVEVVKNETRTYEYSSTDERSDVSGELYYDTDKRKEQASNDQDVSQ